MPNRKVAAILAAGGSARRMGFDKLSAILDDRPVLAHTLHAFDVHPAVGYLVIVTRPDRLDWTINLCRNAGLQTPYTVVAGGDSRQDSVQQGVLACPPEIEYLCIHDAARPLVSEEVIEHAIAAAIVHGAATAAVPVKDTIKVEQNGFSIATPDRTHLMAVQTPQVFERKLYEAAYQQAATAYSDDCQLIEAMGHPVAFSLGDYRNIKLTTAEDFLLAAALLEEENRR